MQTKRKNFTNLTFLLHQEKSLLQICLKRHEVLIYLSRYLDQETAK